MTDSRLPKLYLSSVVIAASGCEGGTFRAWRDRNGLFPETQSSSGWNRYSLADIAVVRAVVMLTDLGLVTQVAIDAAMKMLPTFEQLFSGQIECVEKFRSVVVIGGSGKSGRARPDVSFLDRRDRLFAALIASGRVVALDLWAIFSHIEKAFRVMNSPLARAALILADRLNPDNPKDHGGHKSQQAASTKRRRAQGSRK